MHQSADMHNRCAHNNRRAQTFDIPVHISNNLHKDCVSVLGDTGNPLLAKNRQSANLYIYDSFIYKLPSNMLFIALFAELISIWQVLYLGLWSPEIDRNFIYYFLEVLSEH